MTRIILLAILVSLFTGCAAYKNHSVDVIGVGRDQVAVKFSTPKAESVFFRAYYHDIKEKDSTRIPLYPIVDWHTVKVYCDPPSLNKVALQVAGDDDRITLTEALLYTNRVVDPMEQPWIESSPVLSSLYFVMFDGTEIRYHANKQQPRRQEKNVPTVEGHE